VHLQQLSSFGSRLDTAWTAVNQQSQPGSANTSVASGNGGSNQLTQFVQRESATLQIRTAEGEVLAQSLPAPTQTAATWPATSLAADTLNHLST
jgi:hypothetical protein